MSRVTVIVFGSYVKVLRLYLEKRYPELLRKMDELAKERPELVDGILDKCYRENVYRDFNASVEKLKMLLSEVE